MFSSKKDTIIWHLKQFPRSSYKEIAKMRKVGHEFVEAMAKKEGLERGRAYGDVAVAALSSKQVKEVFKSHAAFTIKIPYIDDGLSEDPIYAATNSVDTQEINLLASKFKYNAKVLLSIAENPKTPVDTLLKIHENIPIIYQLWDKDSSTDDEKSHIRELHEALVRNHRMPISVLNQEANSQYYSIRKSVALNPYTPEVTLRLLSTEKGMRTYLIRNPAIPSDLLNSFASTGSYLNAESAALNKKIAKLSSCSETLDKLSYHWLDEVRFNVAANKHTKKSTLCRLCNDENPNVRRTAIKSLALCKQTMAQENKESPPESLPHEKGVSVPKDKADADAEKISIDRLLRHFPQEAFDAAESSDTSSECLRAMFQFITTNDLIPILKSTKMSHKKFHQLTSKICNNPSLPQDIINTILSFPNERHRIIRNPSLPEDTINEWARSKSWWDRRDAARSCAATQDILDILATDPDSCVRKAVAENSSVTPKTLNKLYDDKMGYVSKAAEKHRRRRQYYPVK